MIAVWTAYRKVQYLIDRYTKKKLFIAAKMVIALQSIEANVPESVARYVVDGILKRKRSNPIPCSGIYSTAAAVVHMEPKTEMAPTLYFTTLNTAWS